MLKTHMGVGIKFFKEKGAGQLLSKKILKFDII